MGWGGWENGRKASEEGERAAGRRGAGRRGGLLGALGRAARGESPRLQPAASSHHREGPRRAPGAGRQRAEQIAAGRSPSPTLPQHHSQDNSSAGRRPRASSARAGGSRRESADQVPQRSPGCSQAAQRPLDPAGGRRVSVRLRADPGRRWGCWRGVGTWREVREDGRRRR